MFEVIVLTGYKGWVFYSSPDKPIIKPIGYLQYMTVNSVAYGIFPACCANGKNQFSSLIFTAMTLCFFVTFSPAGIADVMVSHALALYDQPKYPKGFKHVDYVNPDAPKGGKITLPALGSFDTLNPYVLKGISPSSFAGLYGITELNEPLMAGTSWYLESGDEPQTAYCLVCEWLEYPADYSWVIFQLNPQARFHNGEPITAEDVAHSYKLLISDDAHPAFHNSLISVASVDVLSTHRVRFSFKNKGERSNLLRVGELPVMSKKHWETHTFGKSSGTPQPLSGPYRIKDFALGNYIVLERVKDFWAKDHPVYHGMFNFDEVRFDFYRDRTVAFEAFKSGAADLWMENVSKNWATAYDFPGIKNGTIKKVELPHSIPSGTQAFFLNMRREVFKDARVRQAISLMFDFQWTNKNIFSDAYTRSETHFPNSVMGSRGLPSEKERLLLEPYRDQLPAELFTKEFAFPVYDSPSVLRRNMRLAMKLLKEAGWEYQDHRLVNRETGKPLTFEILINSPTFQRVLLPFSKNLSRIGIETDVRIVDRAQYKVRLDDFDFDMTVFVLPQSASPGQEQRLYFHSSQADVRGSKNLSGIEDPVVDAMIQKITSAATHDDLVAAVRAMDRVLLWNYYTIPHWHLRYHRLAYKNIFQQPANPATMSLAFQTWWLKDLEK
ncbi:MAG: ABC transporter substrate-binding protein [Pseudomonadales bacterium]|nr:ABC transporter substrate-binding protein [Pseudomonadales bacterium]